MLSLILIFENRFKPFTALISTARGAKFPEKPFPLSQAAKSKSAGCAGGIENEMAFSFSEGLVISNDWPGIKLMG